MAKLEIQQIIDSQANSPENSDSLGVINIATQETTTHPIEYPFIQHVDISSSSVQTKPTHAYTHIDSQNTSSISIPIQKNTAASIPEFSINAFEYGDSINFSNKAQPKEFVQEFQEKVFTINYTKINDTSNNWMFWLILLCLVIFGWLRIFFKKQLELLLSSILHYNFAAKSIRNASENSNRFSNILQVLFAINLGLFSFQTFNYFEPLTFKGITSSGIVLGIASGILLMYGVKSLSFKILGVIYAHESYVDEYLYNVHLYNRALGLFLFPVIIAFAFIQPHILNHSIILYSGFFLILIFFLLRIFRGIQISIRANISIFYMFLYFCTLEILPIAVLVKLGTLVINQYYL